ncbi:urease accessory protein UreH domain-containing protein [Thermus scotoductus]|uniref:urease accessory protein UreH domain-containing protein n=3 Tax=Thermus scotoductus TaxID=37636 RepID=UPI000F7FCAF6|nr:sulfite exporter TauE/SafE family protein [Thermus scotoductus]RTH21938.1 cytochrome C biogenesis protein [Thermus scotoductus]
MPRGYVGLGFAFLVLIGLALGSGLLKEVSWELYRVANSLYALLAPWVDGLRREVGVPWLSAFLLGVLAAFAPCQITTGASALAYLAPSALEGRVWPRFLAFLLGKAFTYLALAGVVLFSLGGVLDNPGAVFRPVRLALGPFMVLVGLGLLGVVRWPLAWGVPEGVGARVGTWGGLLGPLALGGVYGLAFCPTLFWLFFGLLLPLALASPLGFLLPGVFALGTGLPLGLLLLLFARLGRGQALKGMRHLGSALLRGAGGVFVVLGILDTVLYWNL